MNVFDQPVVTGAGKRARGWLADFRTFILRGNVVDLAVGFMIGAAFTAIVNSLVGDVITPLIPAAGKGLSGLTFTVPYTGGVVKLGSFINAAISFLILALVVYFFVVRPVNALMARFKPKQPEAVTTRECPFCLSSVPLKATRCAFCTSELPPAPATTPQTKASA